MPVGHRVLHGGDKFVESCIIDEACKQAIRDCIPLGPLHNPANLMGIEACEKVMPGKPQVAVFDTAFHMTMPPKAYRYAIPTKYYEEDHLRRYGFHGTSHRYVSKRAIELMGKPASELKIVVCHLGNGSSLSAVADGKCQDTSMGLVPAGRRSHGHPRRRYRHLRRAVHHEQVQYDGRRVPDDAEQEVRRAGSVERRVLRLP